MVLSGYERCLSIPIGSSDDGELTNYQIKLTLVKGNGTNSGSTIYLNNEALNWPYDVRFSTDEAGNALIDHWREEYDATDGTWWIEVPTIPASGGTTIYLHVGDADAADASDGDATFVLFDDFAGSDIGSDWDVIFDDGSYSVSGSVLTIVGGSGGHEAIGCQTRYSPGTRAIFSVKVAEDTGQFELGVDERSYDGTKSGNHDMARIGYDTPNSRYNNVRANDGYNTYFARSGGLSAASWNEVVVKWASGKTNIKINGSWETEIAKAPSDVAGPLMAAYRTTMYVDWAAVADYAYDEPEISAASWCGGGDPEGSLIGGKLIRGGLLLHGVLGRS